VRKKDVMPKAMQIARIIAKKGRLALRFNERAMNLAETLAVSLQRDLSMSAHVTAIADAKESIRTFLERREPKHSDR
jgi:enoyl-CoA hydratase/carnithine racemase